MFKILALCYKTVMQPAKTRLLSLKWDSVLFYYPMRSCMGYPLVGLKGRLRSFD